MNKHHDWLFWTFSFWGSILKKITSDDRIMVAISQTLALEVNWNFFQIFWLVAEVQVWYCLAWNRLILHIVRFWHVICFT